jgi:hypothetical protein
VLVFNLNFQHIGLSLEENQVHHSKDRKILIYKQHYDFTFTFCICKLLMHLKDLGIHTNRYVCIYVPHIQAATNIVRIT